MPRPSGLDLDDATVFAFDGNRPGWGAVPGSRGDSARCLTWLDIRGKTTCGALGHPGRHELARPGEREVLK